jgi:8-oxo-dGTP diphosphatase
MVEKVVKTIETVAYICIKDRRLLLSRNKNKTAFYMPGGKRDGQEDDIQALARELKEELQINLDTKSTAFYGIFEAQAYGKTEGIWVKIHCYLGAHSNSIAPAMEIEEVRYFTCEEYLSMPDTAPAVRLIIKDLQLKGHIS